MKQKNYRRINPINLGYFNIDADKIFAIISSS